MDAVRAKLRQAILYIERNPKLVRSITSLPLYRQLTLMWKRYELDAMMPLAATSRLRRQRHVASGRRRGAPGHSEEAAPRGTSGPAVVRSQCRRHPGPEELLALSNLRPLASFLQEYVRARPELAQAFPT